MTKYQETWIKGKTTGEAFQRECGSRYEPIRRFLAQYNRPFSVFDFGANLGYFTFRIAEDFPDATVVAVDNRKGLVDLARENALPNVIVLPERMDGKQLDNLACCEGFDVVLALNVLHHMPDWWRAYHAMMKLGSYTFVETPGPGDDGALQRGDHEEILRTVEMNGGELVHQSEAHTTKGAERLMYRQQNWHTRSLEFQSIDAEKRRAPRMRVSTVQFGFDTAEIWQDGISRDFIPGMNLWNACCLKAAWPVDLTKRVKREVDRLESEEKAFHDDLRPWNFIVSGANASSIDTSNKPWRKHPEHSALQTCLGLIKGKQAGR